MSKLMHNEISFSTLKQLIDLLPGHIYWYDKNGIFHGCNDQQARAFGFEKAEDLIGKNGYAMQTPENEAILRATNERVYQTGEMQTAEEPGTYYGTENLFLSKKVPWRDARGNIIGILGVSLDITREKALEQKLLDAKLQAENTLKNIIDLMPGHVYWKDSNFKYLGCNQLQAESAGLASSEEVRGKDDFEMPWADKALAIQKIDQKVLSGDSVFTEENAILKNAEERIFLSKKVPLRDEGGNITGILGVSFDITDRKQAEELRMQNAITEEKMQTIEMLASSIAHELRTPLGSIRMDAETLLETVPSLLKVYHTAEAQGLNVEYISPIRLKNLNNVVQNIRDENIYANSIINMLLTNIRDPEVNQKDCITLHMQSCLTKAIDRYPFVSEAQQQLVCIDQTNDFDFLGIELLVEHVIFNLLKNALYYIDDAGKGKICISLTKGKRQNKVYFKDTGKGIAPEILPKIFERFAGTRHHGTGVGLAFCKEVMRELGGNISCESVLGEYTVFILTFPAIQ